VEESVQLATILLTDLVGSTRLATTVGPVRADQLREEHFAVLRDAIASAAGEEVKNTGDGLMVAFPSASEAVRCAVAIQQLFERRYRGAEQALHIRVGLGAGECTVKDGDYFGMPSIEAARLCAEAPSDGILVSSWVKNLAGRCEGIEFHAAGELELKGFEDPAETFAVSWAPLAEETGASSRWPLPARLRSVPVVSYVGRAEERAALQEALNLARNGTRQVVLLSGEPGIGKTRLASYGAHHAHSEGCAVLWGACSEELAVPYEPWIGICTHVVEHAPNELLQRHVERHKGELARLARNLESRIPDLPAPQVSDPETERYLLFNAVTGLVGEVAETVPLCVVLDDLHWTDAQSLALLKHLLRTYEQGSLQLIATFRDSELGKDHPLTNVLTDMRRLEGVQRITLHGLGADEVAEIMTAVAGHELEADAVELATQIAQETDGNPFFVGEILRGLSESGALVFDESAKRWSIDSSGVIALPESVREVIERRIERLGEESLEALRLAAVVGREFDLELLSAVVEMDETHLLDELEAAVAASVLAESSSQVGRFRFAHALINQTLYDGLGATRRARMHQRVAQALEELYGADAAEHFGELALHWRLAAVSVEKAKAADYALKAGQRALENLAPAEAAKLLADAVELSGSADGRERCKALIGLGEAQRQTGVASFRDTLLEASRMAASLEDAELAASASLANGRGHTSSRFGIVDGERLHAVERAIELDDGRDPVRRARLLALKAQELAFDADFDRRRALAEEAIALARGTGDARTLADVFQRVYEPLRVPSMLALRRSLGDELAARAAELGDPALRYAAHSVSWGTSIECGDIGRAANDLQQLEALAQELDRPTFWWLLTFSQAAWKLACGNLVAGEELSRRGFEIGRDAGQPDAFVALGSQLAFVRRYQGRAGEIIGAVKESSEGIADLAWRGGPAWMLCALDRRAEARQLLEQLEVEGFEQLTNATANALVALAMYAEVAVETGSSSAANSLYGLMEPWADQFIWNGMCGYGHMRMWLGLLAAALGEHRRADEQLQFACEFHEANDMPIWAARGRLGWADALAARGDPAAAREHAARALELSREHGYGLFEPRAAALVETESAAEA
jgi:class 3 adenylate cyclase